MNHDHESVKGRLALYLTGDLPRDEMQAIEAHLVACGPCADAFEVLATDVAAVVRHASAGPLPEVGRVPWPAVARGAAAAIIFVAGFFLGRVSISLPVPTPAAVAEAPSPTTFPRPAESDPPVIHRSSPQVADRGIDQYAASDSPFAASLRALAALRRP